MISHDPLQQRIILEPENWTMKMCVCVCVLARGAAASGGRGLWFIINNLNAPPT